MYTSRDNENDKLFGRYVEARRLKVKSRRILENSRFTLRHLETPVVDEVRSSYRNSFAKEEERWTEEHYIITQY